MDVKLPRLGDTAESGTVVSILVKPGDTIEAGQTILEVENEKAIAPIPSPTAGKVASVRVKEGDTVTVGSVLLTLDGQATNKDSESSDSATPKREARPASPKPRPATEARPPADGELQPESTDEEEPGAEAESESGDDAEADESFPPPAASPYVRKVARELGLDLRRIHGRESGGRIVIEDLRDYIARLKSLAERDSQKPAARPVTKSEPSGRTPPLPQPVQIDFSKWGAVKKQPLSQLRKVIARRMVESQLTVAQVTQFDEADLTQIEALREKFKAEFEKRGAKLTPTLFLIKALVATLRKHPLFNSSLDEVAGEIVLKEYIHLGIAVDTEAGLVVPVIRDVDKKSMIELAHAITDIATRARERKIQPDEMKGGSFTISNQGAIGGGHFTPIVNKPEVAILGVGRTTRKPVAVGEGKIEARPLLPLALTYDHRVIDGAAAARFITDLVAALQNYSDRDVGI